MRARFPFARCTIEPIAAILPGTQYQPGRILPSHEALLNYGHNPGGYASYSGHYPSSGLGLVALVLIVLHLLGRNSCVNIAPVGTIVGMLFWSWLWGGVGLLLGAPLTAFVKLVADCHPALLTISNLLAESRARYRARRKQAERQ